MTGAVSPSWYWSCAAVGVALCVLSIVAARNWPGRWTAWVARSVGVALLADAASWIVVQIHDRRWTPGSGLPLALCNMALIIAALACWWPRPLLVEVTYFWGLAGTIQGLATPDLSVGFPHLQFFQYVVGHLGVVFAAAFLVFGQRVTPRRGAPWRVLAITLLYSAGVASVDVGIGANYMFLRHPPRQWTLLRLLGPWPLYLPAAAALALVVFWLLDVPLSVQRRAAP